MGLGFDGCSTMVGKENSVQKLIRDQYPRVTFFHCYDPTTKRNFSQATRTKAEQLLCSLSTHKFIICLNIIARYSAQLEPVTNSLQENSVNLLDVQKHIENLLLIFENKRRDANECFRSIFTRSVEIADEFGIEIEQPSITRRQINRPNIQKASAEEYFRIFFFIPYMDSLISSLKT
ncbi:hypothetical protein NQ314_015501 [Rhamnusium bicolor]|uniref:DUF4371 domain-containing protein n=1 Tax=Rhamnusium bicolor TaxID=1586634 RepID=A0AAV8WY65_9CUCU|nr:hypothetical protein NQ314_015501 [Rhamnusium bicolor]